MGVLAPKPGLYRRLALLRSEIALRWAGWLYKTEDAGDYMGNVALPGEANILAPVNVPPAIPNAKADANSGRVVSFLTDSMMFFTAVHLS